MLIVTTSLSLVAGLGLAAFAALLAWRRVGSERGSLLSLYGLGLSSLLSAGLLLAAGGAYRIAQLQNDPEMQGAALNRLLHRVKKEPFQQVQLHLVGSDPFQERSGSCLLRFRVVLDASTGEGYTCLLSRNEMRETPSEFEGVRGYVIAWKNIVAAVADKESRTHALKVKHIEDLVYTTIQIAIVDTGAEVGPTPEAMTLALGQNEPLEVFRGSRTLEEVMRDDDGWIVDYPALVTPATSLGNAHWECIRGLDEFSGRLAWLHVACVHLLALGAALVLLWPGQTDGRESTVWDLERLSTPLLALCTLVLTLAGACFGEKIPNNYGYGWDGTTYGLFVEDFPFFRARGFDAYSVQRILPAAAVHYTLRLFPMPRTPFNVIHTYALLDAVLLTLAAWTWGRIAEGLRLNLRDKWLGFTALFLNFFVLKMVSYYPLLNDATAYTVALLMLRCYLAGNQLPLFALTAFGAFTWPVLIHGGACMLIFPRRPEDALREPARPRFNVLLAALAACAYYAFAAWRVRDADNPHGIFFAGRIELQGPVELLALLGLSTDPNQLLIMELLGVSAVFTALYLFAGYWALFDWQSFFDPVDWLRRVKTVSFVVGLLFALLLQRFVSWCASSPAPQGLGSVELVTMFVTESMRWPGGFLVTQIAFFGPGLLLAILCWPTLCQRLQQHGLGLVLYIALGVFLALNGEGRHILTFYVLIVPFLVMAVGARCWPAWVYFLLTVLALVFAKVWLVLHATPDDLDALYAYPGQFYWMNMNPWMGWVPYWVQGAVVLLVGGFAAALLPWRGRERERPDA